MSENPYAPPRESDPAAQSQKRRRAKQLIALGGCLIIGGLTVAVAALIYLSTTANALWPGAPNLEEARDELVHVTGICRKLSALGALITLVGIWLTAGGVYLSDAYQKLRARLQRKH